MNNLKPTLDNCGCCEGIEKLTPAKITNDHGLATLLYRIGTHGMFKESMIRGLSETAFLKELTIREDDDSTIALMDVWALILDILTFYNERIINEGYILTSTERLSLVELAKHISYIPKPGVAAGSWFSFLTEESPGAPTEVKVPVATRVQSIPGQDEKPQTFETIEEIQIKTKWNAIRPKLYENQILTTGSDHLYLKGTNTQLQKGDYILIVQNDYDYDLPNKGWAIRTIKSVDIDGMEDYTSVTWQDGIDEVELLVQSEDNDNDAKVYVFRQRASIFGYNAPDFLSLSEKVKEGYDKTGVDDYDETASIPDWNKDRVIDIGNNIINLDYVYPKILKNSWMVLIQPDQEKLFKIINVEAGSKKEFTLANKSNKIELVGNNLGNFGFRETLVLAQSEELTLAKAPYKNNISGNSIDLDHEYPELLKGQKMIISGKLALEDAAYTDEEPVVSELIEIEALDGMDIILKDQLGYIYQRKTVIINANIAQSTHGETKTEILGSGNAAIPFQKFYLKQKPLTYISSASSSGIATTLEVRVDDILWKEVSTFYNRTSEERIYISRIEDDGTTYIQFGNGITGTRLPSGTENIVATYRVGIGLEGLLKANQLSMLLSPQLGIKSVTNPVASSGAEDPESLKNIRFNAPLTVLTLDRIVSVVDYENFTSAFAGIGKARADLLWKGEDRTVHLTVAAADEGTIDATLEENLLNAIDGARHNNYLVVVQSFKEILFNVKSRIKIHADYLEDVVFTKVKEILVLNYNFESRAFGQGVPPSEIIAIIQGVEGVLAVDLEELGIVGGSTPIKDPFLSGYKPLTSNIAKWDDSGQVILPAELLLIDENKIEIILMD